MDLLVNESPTFQKFVTMWSFKNDVLKVYGQKSRLNNNHLPQNKPCYKIADSREFTLNFRFVKSSSGVAVMIDHVGHHKFYQNLSKQKSKSEYLVSSSF